MAEIVRFRARRRKGPRQAQGESAEVILFPGVFYEYLDECAPPEPERVRTVRQGGSGS